MSISELPCLALKDQKLHHTHITSTIRFRTTNHVWRRGVGTCILKIAVPLLLRMLLVPDNSEQGAQFIRRPAWIGWLGRPEKRAGNEA